MRLAAMLALWLIWGGPFIASALAHGKELEISVTSLIPDPDRPLVRLYRVFVVYEGDLEPVEEAEVQLTAVREEGGPEPNPVRLTAVENKPGLYVGEVTYPRFGTWQVSLQVEAAFGQGEGEAEFVDNVRPGTLNPTEEAALKAEEERIYKLQLFFRFSWWPDVVNILVRITHSTAGMTYFLVTGAVAFTAWFGAPGKRPDFQAWLQRLFLPLALGSLGLLLASGLYSAAFDAPTTPPGIYDLTAMRELPYGLAYLGVFLFKPAIFIALIVLAVQIHKAMQQAWSVASVAGAAQETAMSLTNGPAIARLRRLTLINAGLGLLIVWVVAVVIYLHYVSHLGIFLPSP